jgi:hypothetical protein
MDCLTIKKKKEGEVAEWLKALAWKACILLKVSRVRIPFSPPTDFYFSIVNYKFSLFLNVSKKKIGHTRGFVYLLNQ